MPSCWFVFVGLGYVASGAAYGIDHHVCTWVDAYGRACAFMYMCEHERCVGMGVGIVVVVSGELMRVGVSIRLFVRTLRWTRRT